MRFFSQYQGANYIGAQYESVQYGWLAVSTQYNRMVNRLIVLSNVVIKRVVING